MTTTMRRREDGEHGAISIMAAAMLVVALLATSLAVDVGRVAYVSRDQQGVTDRAAMDTVRKLEDSTAVTMAALHVEAVQAVEESLGRNPGSSGTAQDRAAVGVVLGRVTGDVFTAICGTQPGWVTGGSLPACTDPTLAHGVDDVTAIEVFTGSVVPYVFALGAPTDEDSGIVGRAVRKRARAGFGDPVGAVSAATTAVNLGDGLVTDLLSGLLGADADLSLIGWNGLLQTQVTLREIAVQLGVGSVSQLLDTELTVGQLATVVADALREDSELAADVEATLAELLAIPLGVGLPPIGLGELLDVDPGAAGSALDAGVSAGGLLTAFAQVANQQHAVALDLEVPGLTSVTVTVIEPPQIAVGRPGKLPDGSWRTEATTAQVRVDVGLPLGDVAAGTADGTEDDDLILPEVQAFRDRINAISGCWEAMDEGGTGNGTIRSDLEAAMDAARDKAAELGLLTGALVGLIDGTFDLLGGLLTGLLGCTLFGGSTRDAIKADLHEAVDNYEALLRDLSGTGAAITPGDPVLSLRLARGRNALASITCTEPVQAGTVVNGDFGRVVLTSTSQLAANRDNPAGVDVELLDVDLGVLGAVRVGLRGDMALGQVPPPGQELTFTGPFPGASQEVRGSRTGLGAITDGIGLWTDVRVLGVLDLGPVVNELVARAQGLLSPVLTLVSDAVLDPLLDTLGVQLGVIEAAVQSATCAGPPRLLPNP